MRKRIFVLAGLLCLGMLFTASCQKEEAQKEEAGRLKTAEGSSDHTARSALEPLKEGEAQRTPKKKNAWAETARCETKEKGNRGSPRRLQTETANADAPAANACGLYVDRMLIVSNNFDCETRQQETTCHFGRSSFLFYPVAFGCQPLVFRD